MPVFGPVTTTLRSGKEVTLRSLVPEDAAGFPAFQQQIASETTNTLQVVGILPDPGVMAADWAASASDPFELRLGAFVDGVQVGQLGFHRIRKNPHPWVNHIGHFGMMILKDFWGEGLGRRLLEIMEVHARSVGVVRIEAHVRANNERGIRLYSRMGYAVEGTLRKAALIDGFFVDSLTIAKLLDDGPEWRPPELETARLLLRPVVLADAPSIFAYASDPEVTRYLSWKPHRTMRDSEAFIWDVALANYLKGILAPWAITLKEKPSDVIGTIGCTYVGASKHTMEVGYALGRPHWGRGLMTEAVKAILNCVFGIEGVRRVQARCIVDNVGSVRVMQKAGLKFEGTLRSAFQSPNIAPDGGDAVPDGPVGGKLCDVHLYAVVGGD